MKEKIVEVFKMITGVAYRDLKKEWNEQNLEIDRLQWERNEAHRSAEYLEEKFEKEKKKVSELKEEIKGFKKKVNDFAYELGNKNIEIETYKEDKIELLNELAKTDSELIEARVKIDSLEKQLKEQDALIKDLNTLLEQANSTDNVQPDCEEPCHPDQLSFNFESDELVVSDIEVIPGEVHLNAEELNITCMPMDEGLGKIVVRQNVETKPKKTRKTPVKKTTTKKTTGKRTSKKSKEA